MSAGQDVAPVSLADAARTPLAVAPSASISLSRKALMAGRIAPESVDLNAPRLSLFHSEDGVISLKFSHPAAAPEAPAAEEVAPEAAQDSEDTSPEASQPDSSPDAADTDSDTSKDSNDQEG